MAQPAYDLREFENRPVPRPRIRVQKNERRFALRLRRRFRKIGVVLGGAMFLALLWTFLSCQVTINELNAEVQKTQARLVEEQSQYDYLQTSLDSTTGMTDIALKAVSELGLVKLDPSQITYVSLGEESSISRKENTWQKLVASIKAGALCLVEQLNP